MAAQRTLAVENLRETMRAFRRADKTLNREMRAGLRDVAEPVRSSAEHLAVTGIPRIGIPWSRMRVGVTQSFVYVAPRERGRASRTNPRIRRPNLKTLLLDRAMEPALERNIGVAEQRFNGV